MKNTYNQIDELSAYLFLCNFITCGTNITKPTTIVTNKKISDIQNKMFPISKIKCFLSYIK